MIWCSIDPGKVTGVAIWLGNRLVKVLTVRDKSRLVDYMQELEKIRIEYKIELAVIERYMNFGKQRPNASKVQEQVRVCKDVFPVHFTILTQQWDGKKLSNSYKILLVRDEFGIKVNEHEADAVLMGSRVWFKAKMFGNPEVFFRKLTSTKKKVWPNQKDMAEFAQVNL